MIHGGNLLSWLHTYQSSVLQACMACWVCLVLGPQNRAVILTRPCCLLAHCVCAPPLQVLNIVTLGDGHKGGFFPQGLNGVIA
jgi:hypothetical protein